MFTRFNPAHSTALSWEQKSILLTNSYVCFYIFRIPRCVFTQACVRHFDCLKNRTKYRARESPIRNTELFDSHEKARSSEEVSTWRAKNLPGNFRFSKFLRVVDTGS